MISKKPLFSRSILFVLTTFMGTNAIATNYMPESMAEQITKRAAALNEIKLWLNNSDPNIRITALDTMLKSDDTAMRETAYSIGLNNADTTMRAVAVRNKFNDLQIIFVKFHLLSGVSEQVKAKFNEFGGSLSMSIRHYEETNGRFSFIAPGSIYKYEGNISGLRLMFKSADCKGELMFNERAVYTGDITCDKITFPASLSLI